MRRQQIVSCGEYSNSTALDSSKRRRHPGHLLLLSGLLLGVWMTLAFAEEPAGKDMGLFYQQNCVRCHGRDGSALGPDGQKLKGQDLTDERWLKNTDDDEMVGAILKGKFFGIAMPKFKDKLSRDEAQRMVTEIIRKTRKGKVIGPETAEADEK